MRIKLIVDEKISVWNRTYAIYESDSVEDAVAEYWKNGYDNTIDIDSEYIYESEEPIQKSKDNPVTVEIMDADYNTISTN